MVPPGLVGHKADFQRHNGRDGPRGFPLMFRLPRATQILGATHISWLHAFIEVRSTVQIHPIFFDIVVQRESHTARPRTAYRRKLRRPDHHHAGD
jgi:hypothetical protein